MWRTRRLACQTIDMPGHHHFSILTELEDPGTTLSGLLLRQMGFR